MKCSIHLVNPASMSASYYDAGIFTASGLNPVAHMVDLAIGTVAGLVPDDFEVTLCDENLKPADLDVAAEFVGITGKVSQWNRMRDLADAYRERGKVVLIGGPFASLCPDTVRPHCDILVRGEIEEIADEIFSDLRSGSWKREYIGTKPDLSRTPMPRLDLYPNDRTLLGAIQTSRGCPFQCEFCDVIQYQGRKQRHKPVERVIEELDQLYDHGYRFVFIADDNFTASRKRAKRLLRAIRDWNRSRDGRRVGFCTQLSIDTAQDEEMLQLLYEAGIVEVFIGLETPSEESLREVKKHQNLKIDLVEQVERFLEHGIKVTGGMMVGFDADDLGIFQRQYEFAMSLPVPVFTAGPLMAPAATPLNARLKQENRLVEGESETVGEVWTTNIIPKQLTREQLLEGVRWLCNKLYDPASFLTRLQRLAEILGRKTGLPNLADPKGLEGPRSVELEALPLIKQLALKGPGEARLVWGVFKLIKKNPALAEVLPWYLILYAQFRFAYEQGGIWKPRSRVVRAVHRRALGALLRVPSLFGARRAA